ncbi:MAG: hypothetical protein FVQ77_13650 [Cytophagales bacterium]|nr:hypothetical protein [Cytophagales bacterium]
MKKIILVTAMSGFLMATLFYTGCKKYDEGPALSLRSKKGRVANVWKIQWAYDFNNGVETTADFAGETWEFTRKGEFTERDQGIVDKIGTWELVSDKKVLFIDMLSGGGDDTYDILKLKEKEMWLKDQNEELHLIPN